MPFDRQQGQIWQTIPGTKRLFCRSWAKLIALKKAADMSCFRPQPTIRREDAEPIRGPLGLPIGHTGYGCDGCNAATCLFQLNNRFHDLPVIFFATVGIFSPLLRRVCVKQFALNR